MAILREKFRYRVKFVEKRDTKNGTATDFMIGEKAGDQWISIRCTAFADLPIVDGDIVVIKRIQLFEIKEYKDKLYYNAVVGAERFDGKKDESPFDI